MAIADSEASSKTQAAARAQQARTRFNQSMKLVRRAHLYAGLFMTPWVFLYGVTAMLFNHPLVFPDAEQKHRSIAPADLAGTPLATFPTPQVLASQVVSAINAAGGTDSDSAPRYRLVKPDEAAFAREYLTSVPGGDTDHLVRLDLASGIGSVRTAPSRKEAERGGPAAVRPPACQTRIGADGGGHQVREHAPDPVRAPASAAGCEPDGRPAGKSGGTARRKTRRRASKNRTT